jgi:hypothetical protein
VPFYKYHGVLAGFAAFKNHVSFGFAAVLQSEDRKMLERKGYITGKNHTNQVRPKSADHSDKANSKSKSKNE